MGDWRESFKASLIRRDAVRRATIHWLALGYEIQLFRYIGHQLMSWTQRMYQPAYGNSLLLICEEMERPLWLGKG